MKKKLGTAILIMSFLMINSVFGSLLEGELEYEFKVNIGDTMTYTYSKVYRGSDSDQDDDPNKFPYSIVTNENQTVNISIQILIPYICINQYWGDTICCYAVALQDRSICIRG